MDDFETMFYNLISRSIAVAILIIILYVFFTNILRIDKYTYMDLVRDVLVSVKW